MSGWGTQQYGTGPWGVGGGYAPGADAGRTFAAGDRIVRVRLPFVPVADDSTAVGDALNPKTWRVESMNDGRQLTPLSVRQLDAKTFEVLTLERLDPAQLEMRLTSVGLLSADGAPVPTQTWDFPGSLLVSNTTAQAKTAAAALALRDIANPQTPNSPVGGTLQTPNSPVGGTLQITSAGDYKSVTGEALIRKLIIRRLISKRGDFFHLPNYGAGLRVKDTMANVDLRKLAKELEAQIKFEPEVEAAAVGLSYSAGQSALVVQIRAKLRQIGQEVSVSMTVPSGTMQF